MRRRLSFKKIIALIAVIALVFSSGCGRGKAPAPVGEIRPASVETEKAQGGETVTVLRSEILSLPDRGVTLRHTAMAGGYIYLCGEDDNGKYSFYRMDKEFRISRLNVSYDEPVENFTADDSGNMYIINSDDSGKLRIVWVNADGGSRNIDSSAIAEAGMVSSFAAMREGFLVNAGQELLAVSKEGTLIKRLGAYQGGIWLVRLSDDTSIVVYTHGAGINIPSETDQPRRIDRLDGDFNVSGSAELTGNYVSFFGGTGGELFTALEGNVYEYDYLSGGLTKHFDVATSPLTPEYYLGNNKYFAVDRGAPVKLWAEQRTGVKERVLAGYNIDGRIAAAAQMFNATNNGYIITLDDYSRYDEYDNTGAGAVRFAADIISGHTPDIYDLSNVSVEKYAAKGLLFELTPFFEHDSEINIYDKLVEYTGCDGGSYQLPLGFMLAVVCGAPDTVQVPFTVDDLRMLAENYSAETVLGSGMTRSRFINCALWSMHDELYSPTDKTCRFDTEEFAAMLSIAAELPEEKDMYYDDYASAINGDQLLLDGWLGPRFVDFISFFYTIYGENVCITGFPSSKGHGAAIQPQLPLGMSAASANKEGVWAFFRFLLSENMQQNYFAQWFFPAEINTLKGFIEDSITEHIEAPVSLALLQGGKLTGALDETTARTAVRELFDSVDSAAVYDSEIYDIILNSCGALWNGDCTAQQAAANIQSKASIYISEQYG